MKSLFITKHKWTEFNFVVPKMSALGVNNILNYKTHRNKPVTSDYIVVYKLKFAMIIIISSKFSYRIFDQKGFNWPFLNIVSAGSCGSEMQGNYLAVTTLAFRTK